jgi:putative intracellular protease/amidase
MTMRAVILAANGVEDCELFYPPYRFREQDIPAFCREIFRAMKK